MTERRADEIADGLVAIGQRGDDHRVLAARLREQREVRPPREKSARGLDRAGQDHGVHARVGDEAAARPRRRGSAGTRAPLAECRRPTAPGPDASRPAPLRGRASGSPNCPRRGRRARRPQEWTAGSSRAVPTTSRAARSGTGEIAHAVRAAARIVAREVDRLGDLGVGFRHRLGAVRRSSPRPGRRDASPSTAAARRARRGAPRPAGPPTSGCAARAASSARLTSARSARAWRYATRPGGTGRALPPGRRRPPASPPIWIGDRLVRALSPLVHHPLDPPRLAAIAQSCRARWRRQRRRETAGEILDAASAAAVLGASRRIRQGVDDLDAPRKRSRSRAHSGEPGSRPKTWRRKLSWARVLVERRMR